MQFATLAPAEREAALDRAVHSLRREHPELSAGEVLSRRQQIGLAVVAAVVLACAVLDVLLTAQVVVAMIIAVYVVMTLNRVLLFVRSRRPDTTIVVSDVDALAVSDADLPRFTVLVPAYKEPEVVHRLVDHLDQLDYPRHRLQILLLLEEDDHETVDAVRHMIMGDHFTVVLVPPAEPRTKPKALNYALAVATGDVVCIYDAEDEPEPLQLRRAAVALRDAPEKVACVQAKLSFANAGQNLITKWFTIEYAMWFGLFLPGLVAMGAPLPLGGTSNHFRRSVLDDLGAWDAHNVTEDADLGIRMARLGYRCAVLESTTLEEANSDAINWVKQRSRWYKGYLQTLLIHLRHPRTVRRQFGTKGFGQFLLFVGGTPILAVLNPIFWTATAVWFVGHPHVIRVLFPAPVFYVGTACWIFGNFVIAYLTILTCRLTDRTDLVVAALLVPVYWVMMAVAAVKAVYQLVADPSYWEKTTHGLDLRDPPIDLRNAPGAEVSPAAPRNAPTA